MSGVSNLCLEWQDTQLGEVAAETEKNIHLLEREYRKNAGGVAISFLCNAGRFNATCLECMWREQEVRE